jgi:hypothetical protein
MALPVTIPNTFANATASIPLSQLDANFSTLSNAINGINSGSETLVNLKASNVTITGGTLTGITAANIAGANISSGNVTITFASLANGNAASPSLRFTDDTDTGIYNSGANAISFTEGGTGYRIGYRNIPDGGPKNTSYTLTTADIGKYVQITSGGSITVPDGTFSNGDAVSLFNNTNAAVTVNCAISTAYIAGTDSDKANVSLATRGIATILFANANVCVITGNVS